MNKRIKHVQGPIIQTQHTHLFSIMRYSYHYYILIIDRINRGRVKSVVLKPSTVDTKLKFSSAMQVWVVHHLKTGKGAQFIPIEQRVHADNNGKLSWR
jgi:hypothetical protein